MVWYCPPGVTDGNEATPAQPRVVVSHPTEPAAPREAIVLGLVATLLTLALAAPYAWAGAVWTFAELDVLARARGALGEPLTGLERSPWLPDALRALALQQAGGGGDNHLADSAIRVPNVIASALLVGLAAACARLWSGRAAALAAIAVAMAAPNTLIAATTALGQPVLEVATTTTILACLVAVEARGLVVRRLAIVVAAGGFVAGVSSGGVALGLAMPATIAAVLLLASGERDSDFAGDTRELKEGISPATRRTAAIVMLAAIATSSAGLAAWLVARQSFGYVPALGAAKFTDWVTRPWEVSVADGLEAAALQMGPLAGFAVAGLVLGGGARHRCGTWIAITLAFVVAWAFAYGRGPALLTVPTAVLAGHGLVTTMARLHESAGRLAAFIGLAGTAIVGKDLTRIPELVIAIVARRQPRDVPVDDTLLFTEQLASGPMKLLLVVLIAGFVWLALTRVERLRALVSPRLASSLPIILGVTASYGFAAAAWQFYLPHVHTQLSVAHHARQLRVWSDDGLEIGRLATTDRGLERYGPTFDHRAATRPELADWLDTQAPRVAVIRPNDLPGLWADMRRRERVLAVLSDPHSGVLLVGNVVPEGGQDRAPFAEIVLAKAPELDHPLDLEVDGRVRLVGWEFAEPPRRGRDAELVVALEILRPVPSNLRMVTKLQRGRLSLAGREAFVPTEGALPPGNWRVGDVIVVRRKIRLSRLEVFPGEHELVFALRRGENDPLHITRPEPATSGEVRVNERKTSAVIGTVDVR